MLDELFDKAKVMLDREGGKGDYIRAWYGNRAYLMDMERLRVIHIPGDFELPQGEMTYWPDLWAEADKCH